MKLSSYIFMASLLTTTTCWAGDAFKNINSVTKLQTGDVGSDKTCTIDGDEITAVVNSDGSIARNRAAGVEFCKELGAYTTLTPINIGTCTLQTTGPAAGGLTCTN
jgi:hypothetical protein